MRTILFIAVISTLISCSPANKKKDLKNHKETDTLVSFSGSWLDEDYYNSITKLKSPKAAQDGAEFIIIPNSTLQDMIMIYNFHEGGSPLRVVKDKDKYEIWDSEEGRVTQKQADIKLLDNTKIQLGEKKFVKINGSGELGHEKILEEILFKGTYWNEKGNPVEFKADGTVTGIEEISYYEPVIDYFGEGMEVDQVALGKSKENTVLYGFKFEANTLTIFQLNCLNFDESTKSCVEVGYGKLLYTLRLKNNK